eukprot:bmy_20579T0
MATGFPLLNLRKSFFYGLCSIRREGSIVIKCSPIISLLFMSYHIGLRVQVPPEKRQVSVTCWCHGECELWVRRKTKCQPEQANSGGLPAKARVAKKDDPERPAPLFCVRTN